MKHHTPMTHDDWSTLEHDPTVAPLLKKVEDARATRERAVTDYDSAVMQLYHAVCQYYQERACVDKENGGSNAADV